MKPRASAGSLPVYLRAGFAEEVDLGKDGVAQFDFLRTAHRRQQALTLQQVLLVDQPAERIEEGRDHIERLDQRFVLCAAGAVRCRVRIVDDHRHADRTFVQHFLFAQPVIAEVVAVIGGKDDHRVVHPPRVFHPRKQAAHLVVDLLDQPHIGGHHIVARRPWKSSGFPDASYALRARDARCRAPRPTVPAAESGCGRTYCDRARARYKASVGLDRTGVQQEGIVAYVPP